MGVASSATKAKDKGILRQFGHTKQKEDRLLEHVLY